MIKKWFKCALIRALKTMAETAVSLVTIGQAFGEINWLHVISVSVVAGIYSMLISIKGIPEV